MIRVLLADSHRLLHPSIHAIFSATSDLMLTGEVTNGHELRQICQEHHPDLILFSPNVDSSSITDTLDDLKKQCPSIKILAMLSHPEEICVRQLVSHGATGIILKSDTPDKLLEAIYTIVQGQPWFSSTLIPRLVQLQQLPNFDNELTDRELDVLQLLAAENTNAEMAHALNMAERTVRCHLENIYSKLGVKSRVGAVVQAIKLNLISG